MNVVNRKRSSENGGRTAACQCHGRGMQVWECNDAPVRSHPDVQPSL